jgi:hypothetical protein
VVEVGAEEIINLEISTEQNNKNRFVHLLILISILPLHSGLCHFQSPIHSNRNKFYQLGNSAEFFEL